MNNILILILGGYFDFDKEGTNCKMGEFVFFNFNPFAEVRARSAKARYPARKINNTSSIQLLHIPRQCFAEFEYLGRLPRERVWSELQRRPLDHSFYLGMV